MLNANFTQAAEYLSYAFEHCPKHASAQGNKRLILTALVPVRMLLGKFPSEALLQKYKLTQYMEITRAVMLGDLRTFTAAMEKWWPTMKPGDEELDEAGKTSLAAVNQAREGIRATMGEEVDAEALGKAIEGLEAKLASLQEVLDKDRTAPHPRVMVPKLTEMIEALKAIQGAGAEVTGLQRYSVSAGMASLIEAHQRGVAQLLRRSAGGMPRTPIRPRLRDDSIRALPRPAVTGRPVVPKAEPH